MKKKTAYVILGAIFIAALAFRLYFAFQTPYFSPDAYFDIRQIEHIRAHGLPLFNDLLGYGGRSIVFLPLFHYIAAIAALLMPLAAALKIVPSLFAALLVPVIYLISFELTKREDAALVSAFLSGFIPIFISETLNSVSVYTLAVPLIFFLLYCLMKIEERKYSVFFLLTISVLALIHASSLMLVLALLLYLLLSRMEGIKTAKPEAELILFSSVLVSWVIFTVFRPLIAMLGVGVVWQNIPQLVISSYFSQFNALSAIYKIGIIPFLAAVFVIYMHLTREKSKNAYLLLSFALVTLLLLWLKLVKLNAGLMMLAVVFVALFSQFYNKFASYLKNTKFSRFSGAIIMLLLLLLAFGSVLPSISYARSAYRQAPTDSIYNALLWLKGNSPEDAVIMAPLSEGHLITAVAERRNIADTNFIFSSDAAQRLEDINLFFTTPSDVEAIRVLNKYGAGYVLLTAPALRGYGIREYEHTGNRDCFELVYDSKDAQVYRSLCEVQYD